MRHSLLLAVLAACLLAVVLGAAAQAQLVNSLNPEALPGLLKQPVKLFATTDPQHEGHDYLEVAAGGKATVATITGPAVILRVWSTSSDNAQLVLDLTRDGKTEPVYGKGQLPAGAGANDPLRSLDGKEYWSYIPLGVRQKAVFTARNLDKTNPLKVFLQVAYRPATPADLAGLTRARVAEMRQAVGFAVSTPDYGATGKALEGTVAPGQPWQTSFSGPTLVRPLILTFNGATIEQLQATRFTLTCDGQVTVDAPLGALFCQYWGLADYSSVATAVSGQQFILRLPLPVAQTLSLALEKYNGDPVTGASLQVYTQPLKAAPQYRLCAQYFAGISVRGEPLHLASLTGPGIFLGSNLAVDGLEHKSFAFLEGNEQIYVDGATQPSWEGTGTEDYFNNAWYFESGVLGRPFHGVTFKQDKEPPRVAAYRYLVGDSVPFKSSLKLDLQHGSRNSSPDTLYKAVVFWYQQPPATITTPAEAKAPVKTETAPDEAAEPSPYGTLVGIGLGAIVLIAVVLWLLKRRGK